MNHMKLADYALIPGANIMFLFFSLLLTSCSSTADPVKNGFDLRNSLIPPSKIKSGGPPKDGIPALTDPAVIPADRASDLNGSDPVIGVQLNGDVRAYPLKILVHHENVNDTVGGRPIAVTY